MLPGARAPECYVGTEGHTDLSARLEGLKGQGRPCGLRDSSGEQERGPRPEGMGGVLPSEALVIFKYLNKWPTENTVLILAAPSIAERLRVT